MLPPVNFVSNTTLPAFSGNRGFERDRASLVKKTLEYRTVRK
jgi:hypothetical protein